MAPLSSKFGTHKIVNARFWTWLVLFFRLKSYLGRDLEKAPEVELRQEVREHLGECRVLLCFRPAERRKRYRVMSGYESRAGLAT